MRPRSLPFFDFSTSGQGTQGQLKVFSAQFTRRTRIACAFHAVCFGNYAFFQRLGRLPPAATKSVRSSSSFTVESLLRSVAVKLPAPGNKPNTGEDGCHFEACNASASSPCWPRWDFSCYGVPLRAWDGYPPLRGKPFHRPPGQICLQDRGRRPTSSVPRFF